MSSAASPAPSTTAPAPAPPSYPGLPRYVEPYRHPSFPPPPPIHPSRLGGRSPLGPSAARPQQNFVPVQTMIQQAQQQPQSAYGDSMQGLQQSVQGLQQPVQGLQQPVMPPTYAGAQPQTKMGGGYPAMPNPPTTSPVSGDPGMAGGGMTSTTQPVGVAVPVDVQPFIAGGEGGFSTGGSYATPLRGSDLIPEDYANLYGGRFGRGG